MPNFTIIIKGQIKQCNNLANFITLFDKIDKKTIKKEENNYKVSLKIKKDNFFKNYKNILSFALKNNLDLRKLADNYALFGENIDHKIIEIKERDPFGND